MSFDEIRALADAVLFEGYALYPYRASAPKNRLRWQFGVLAPRGWSEAGGGDPWWQETQCLVEPAEGAAAAPAIRGKLRFLQLRARDVPGAGSWDEGDVREVDFEAPALLHEGAARCEVRTFELPGPHGPLRGRLCVSMDRLPAVAPLALLSVRVENLASQPEPGTPRADALHVSLVGTHVMLAASGAAFFSLRDPPHWARPAAEACRNTGTYPVLAGATGRRDLLLSAPVILEDHAAVAPESSRDLYDATEIDEILTLRILTLTDEEKRQARATDPRVAALLDHVERLGPQEMSQLHGAIRQLRPVGPAPALVVGGVALTAGSRVRLRPGARRTDAQDMFLAGMSATVRAVMRDTEDRECLAVTVDDDPATELLLAHGRHHYFYADEVEPA
jgi:hypothetical protein